MATYTYTIIRLPKTPTLHTVATLREAKDIIAASMYTAPRASKWYKQGETHQDGSYHTMYYNDDSDYAIEAKENV